MTTSKNEKDPGNPAIVTEVPKDKVRGRFTLEELLTGMKPERSEFMEDDWPVGEEPI